MDETGVFQRQQAAEYPAYAIESRRLRSFEDWPKQMKQKPAQLADAGFFYTGSFDSVTCFSCGGGLRSWEEDDDPWEQHALYFGVVCKYVRLIKGENYHDDVITKLAAKRIENEKEEEESLAPTKKTAVAENEQPVTSSSTTVDNNICKICFANEYNSVFTPCGHIIACVKCASAMNLCPVCQRPFKEILRVYFS